MSYCVDDDGKDRVIFLSASDAAALPTAMQEAEGAEGAVRENGEIDWDCPCIRPMTEGPCGVAFMDAFECFVGSTTEPKGSECYEKFKLMQDCIVENEEYYSKGDKAKAEDDGPDVDADEDEQMANSETAVPV